MSTAVDVAYPVELAREWQSCADVFSAAFGGVNSAQHLADADVQRVVLVDTDLAALRRMTLRDGWSAVHEDAFAWAERQADNTFDAVVLDPWTGDLSRKVIAHLPTFRRIARRHVVVGVAHAELDSDFLADGWKVVDVIRRSDRLGGVYWVVLEWQ